MTRGVSPYLENLDILHSISPTSCVVHLRPFLDYTHYVGYGETRQCQIMAWMEDENIASALYWFQLVFKRHMEINQILCVRGGTWRSGCSVGGGVGPGKGNSAGKSFSNT